MSQYIHVYSCLVLESNCFHVAQWSTGYTIIINIYLYIVISAKNFTCYRFYYESPGVFSPDQLSELRQVTLSHIVCMSSDNITQVPRDLFTMSQFPRQYVKCDSGKIPELNLNVWASCCHGKNL